jgi:hypothetical protein
MTASEVRRQLIAQYGYTEEELPTSETIRRKLNDLGYTLKRVLKTKPIKKIPETEAIFEQVKQINTQADHDPHTLRISIISKNGLWKFLLNQYSYWIIFFVEVSKQENQKIFRWALPTLLFNNNSLICDNVPL